MIMKDKMIMFNDGEIHILDFDKDEFDILENTIKGSSVETRRIKGSEKFYRVLLVKNIILHEKII